MIVVTSRSPHSVLLELSGGCESPSDFASYPDNYPINSIYTNKALNII